MTKPETIAVDTSEHDEHLAAGGDPRTAPGFAVNVEVTPELLDGYIEAVCETAPGEARRMAVRGITSPPDGSVAFTFRGEGSKDCDACKGSGVVVNDGGMPWPGDAWTGDILPHYVGGTVLKVGEAMECPLCHPAKERPGRPSPEHVWLADEWRLL